MLPDIKISDYSYDLPDERIAKYPLAERDSSKLLQFRDGKVSEHVFREIPSLLPSGSLMVFNDTKVVPARMHFRRQTGAVIEIFCLEPCSPSEYVRSFDSREKCSWKCIVGNAKKWKGDVLDLYNVDSDEVISKMDLKASLISREGATAVVEFSWSDGAAFSEVLDRCGSIPIPPYLNRETEELDRERYQTLYAKYRGSVAAPTAGLHFTERVLEEIRDRGIEEAEVCLHVGAGTFLPVKSENVAQHTMHREPFSVSRQLISELAQGRRKVIAVGTTSVRTLESLYYIGVKCLEEGAPSDVGQWMPYEREYGYSLSEALQGILDYLDANGLDTLTAGTRIIIVPGFKFRIVDVLVTNFHQPQSTLLLLISAFVGGCWRPVYDYALQNGFRFLSYGDSSVLFRQ